LNYNQNIYNMATFCVEKQPKLTILINEYNIIVIFEQFLCVMFEFQLGSLHISKDVAYNANNKFSSSMHQMLTLKPKESIGWWTQGDTWLLVTTCLFICKKPTLCHELLYPWSKQPLWVGLSNKTLKILILTFNF
jgi:hypothetical protein